MGTKNNPGNFDCYSRLDPDEPHFVLMGRDPVAWFVVVMWCAFREQVGKKEPEKDQEALQCAIAMREWAIAKGKQEQVEQLQKVIEVFDPGFGQNFMDLVRTRASGV